MPAERLYKEAEALDGVAQLLDRFALRRSVLDVGCANYEGDYGFGLVHSMVLERCTTCVGVDIDPAVLRLPRSPKARYFHADAETFKLDQTFDLVFCGDVIEHVSNPGLFLRNARAMMERGSDLIIVTPNPYGLRNIVGLFRGFEPPIHPEHTMLLPIAGMHQLAVRHGLRVRQVFLIKGQESRRGERMLARSYKVLYHALMNFRVARKFADTFAFQLVRAD
jgi:SAM-dependent methyltransferase